MKYEDVINRIDRYIKSDKYQPIIVDMPNIHLYKKIIEHYNVGCYDIQKVSSFCMEEGLPLMRVCHKSVTHPFFVCFCIF